MRAREDSPFWAARHHAASIISNAMAARIILTTRLFISLRRECWSALLLNCTMRQIAVSKNPSYDPYSELGDPYADDFTRHSVIRPKLCTASSTRGTAGHP